MQRLVLWVLLVVAVSCWTRRAAAQVTSTPDAAPPGATPSAAQPRAESPRFEVYDKNAKLRVGLLAGGIPLFVLSYGLPCLGARGVWCVPFAGPIIKIKHIADKEAQADPEEDGIIPPVFVYTLLVELAAVQLASASLITAGALLPRREGRRVVKTVSLVPSFSPGAVGLSAVGTF